MTTLAQINETLEEHTPLLEGSRDGISQLQTSFGRFLRGSLDDLESQRESMGRGTTAVPTSTQVQQTREQGEGLFNPDMLTGLFAGLGSAFSLATIGALFKALLKRGIFAAAAITLADEIGAYVKNLTGSELVGDITEKGIVYGSLGALLFGKKGAISGAIIGASIVFGDRLAEEIRKHKIGGEEFSNVLAEATKSAVTIGTGVGVGFLFGGPVGAIIGGLVAGIPELVRLIGLYNTDEDFKRDVDALFAKIKGAYEAILNSVTDAVNSIIDPIASYFTFSGAERTKLQELDPQLAAQIADVEAQMKAPLDIMRGNVSSTADERRAAAEQLKALRAQKKALTERAEALVEGKVPGLETLVPAVPETLTENRQKVLSIQDTAERIAIDLGKSPAEAAAIQRRVSNRMSNSLTPEKTGELTLSRELGFGNDIEKLRARIDQMENKGTTQVVDASQRSGDTNVVTQNTNISGSGPSVDQSDLVRNAMQNVSGRPVY